MASRVRNIRDLNKIFPVPDNTRLSRRTAHIRPSKPEIPKLFRRDLYAFLLFDDRPSHKSVAQFVEQQFGWLDDLARSNEIIIFLFLPPKKGKTKNYSRVTLANENIQNPSLEVASKFGIKPNQLPGIILFNTFSQLGTNTGVYLPMKAAMFQDDYEDAEKVFADLFSAISDCRRNAASPEQLLSNLRRKIASMRRSQQARPALLYLKSSLVALVTFSGPLLEVMAKAFAEASVKNPTGT